MWCDMEMGPENPCFIFKERINSQLFKLQRYKSMYENSNKEVENEKEERLHKFE